nr:hypothetical protein CFP56_73623 [Quercus suber]
MTWILFSATSTNRQFETHGAPKLEACSNSLFVLAFRDVENYCLSLILLGQGIVGLKSEWWFIDTTEITASRLLKFKQLNVIVMS